MIEQLAIETQKLDDEIGKLKEKIANPSKIKLTKEQFLNLVKLAPDKMRAGSAVEKDRVARILFLNLRINDKNGLSVIWKEPFDSLVKAIEMSSGADERTRTSTSISSLRSERSASTDSATSASKKLFYCNPLLANRPVLNISKAIHRRVKPSWVESVDCISGDV